MQGENHLISDELVSQSSDLNQFCSKARCFPVTGYFETSSPNDPKMTLNTKGQICMLQVSWSPNFHSISLCN